MMLTTLHSDLRPRWMQAIKPVHALFVVLLTLPAINHAENIILTQEIRVSNGSDDAE
jgi:hypothetical protein